MQIEASRRGYAFAVVKPRGNRNFETHTVSITFAIDEGPRVYIERINIHGNTRTRDYVIRREFDISEGDAYNRALVDRAERRLKNLDFFKTVKITTEPGSSSDRVVLDVELEEKSTGDFSVSGGYSTTDGALAEVSISDATSSAAACTRKLRSPTASMRAAYRCRLLSRICLDYRVARRHRRVLPRAARQQLYFVRHQNRRLLAAIGLWPSRGSVVATSLFALSAGDHAAGRSSTIVTTFLADRAFYPTPAYIDRCGRRHRSHRQCPERPAAGLFGRRRIFLAGSPGTGQRRDVDFVGRLFAHLQYAR